MGSTNTVSNGEASIPIFTRQQYDVFLSFRGPDTRAGFTDHLYIKLTEAGIETFRDEDVLRVGEVISSELIEGIHQSKIAIPIFSKGYAASKWCLEELAHMVECKRSRGLKVMPIFYDVTPSDVRNQTGDFATAFALHENPYDVETIRGWKEALNEIGKLKGWDISSDSRRHEGRLVNEIVAKVQQELKMQYILQAKSLAILWEKTWRILRVALTILYLLLFFSLFSFSAYIVARGFLSDYRKGVITFD